MTTLDETILEILKVRIKAAHAAGKIDVLAGLIGAFSDIEKEILAAETTAEKQEREAAFFRALRRRELP